MKERSIFDVLQQNVHNPYIVNVLDHPRIEAFDVSGNPISETPEGTIASITHVNFFGIKIGFDESHAKDQFQICFVETSENHARPKGMVMVVGTRETGVRLILKNTLGTLISKNGVSYSEEHFWVKYNPRDDGIFIVGESESKITRFSGGDRGGYLSPNNLTLVLSDEETITIAKTAAQVE